MESIVEVDVAIIGGGAAGVSAAVAAASEGVSTILIERNSFLGGKATASAVGTVCGLYFRSKKDKARLINSGFLKEFTERLASKSVRKPYAYKEGLYFLPYDPFSFQFISDELIKENSIPLLLQSTCIQAKGEGDVIKELEVFHNNSLQRIRPTSVVDTSGEALINRLAGGEILSSKEFQTASQVFSLEGVREEDEQKSSLSMIRALEKGVLNGDLRKGLERVSVVHGSLQRGQVTLKLSIAERLTSDSTVINKIQQGASEAVDLITKYLIAHVESLKRAHLSFIAPEVGIRTGLRPKGKYILTEEDVLSCKTWEHPIANGSWPIEIWGLEKRPTMKYFELDNFYQIPMDTLISSNFKNLFFGGRNISATDEAIGSARVIGTCLQTGFAAGKLASFYTLKKDLFKVVELIKPSLEAI